MSSNTISTATSAQEPGGAPSGFEADRTADSLGGAVRAYVDRVRGGDLGALPAVLGIVVLGLLFTILRPETFLTPRNMANLADQAAPIIILAMGLVFVLLLGEIDLSAGVVSGVCAAVMAKLLADVGAPWYVAVLARDRHRRAHRPVHRQPRRARRASRRSSSPWRSSSAGRASPCG